MRSWHPECDADQYAKDLGIHKVLTHVGHKSSCLLKAADYELIYIKYAHGGNLLFAGQLHLSQFSAREQRF